MVFTRVLKGDKTIHRPCVCDKLGMDCNGCKWMMKLSGGYMNIVVIDGQGGSIGKSLVESIKKAYPSLNLLAIGTNTIATSQMLKAGADHGATGENPVVVACKKADVVIGPIGMIQANALFGEITPLMATAISESAAQKILIPVSKCNMVVAGLQKLTMAEYIAAAVDEVGLIVNAK